jgi:flagellar assembly factor FliW
LQMLEEYPEIALYRKQEGIATFRQYKNIYNYVNYVLVVHYELLKSYSCRIETKVGYKLELDNDRYIDVIDN